MSREIKKKPEWSGIILAGGLGSRLMPLTTKICKPMVPVTNCPMIQYAIEHLRYAGIRKIIVCVKHFGDKLRDLILSWWPEEKQKELDVEILIPNLDSKGTADAVRLAGALVDTPHFIVSMADIITNLNLEKFMEFHRQKDAFATISMKRIEQMATKYGNTVLDPDGKILRFLEKPSSEEIYLSALTTQEGEPLPIINTGIYCFKREILDLLEQYRLNDFGHDVFPYLLENKYPLYGFVDDYYWLDIGNPQTYLWANWDMLRLYGWPITPLGTRQGQDHIWYLDDDKPPKTVTHGDHVAFGKNNQFGENITVGVLTSIGSNCKIGSNTTITRSVIWDNVEIGDNCTIEQSVIADGCKIGDNCIIRSNTILGPGAVVSEGTILDARIVEADKEI